MLLQFQGGLKMQHPGTKALISSLTLALLSGSCATGNLSNYPQIPESEGHITGKLGPEAAEIPAPVKSTGFVPPPKAVEKAETYSVVVNEVPAKELLFALARDTKQNIDVDPAIQGLVTLNAVNETLPAILERISRQVDIRYKMEGSTLVVTRDTPYFKTYPVNYVNLTRNTTSTDSVSGQIVGVGAAPGTSGGGAQQASATGSANYSSTSVTSTSNNNFWDVLKENIRSILNATHAQSLSAEEKAMRAEALRAAQDQRLQEAGAVARAGTGADKLYATAFGGPTPSLTGDVKDDIVVNQVAGTVSVFGTEKQHSLVQQYLDGVSDASRRQVLIEASVVDVTLSDEYQGGVDFSKIGNWTITQSLINPLAAPGVTPPPFTQINYAVAGNTNINSTIQLLEQFGKTRVLSSPKLMALNNQTALLKVVENVVYFSVTAVPAVLSTSSTTVTQQTFNTQAQTVPIGLVMSVTPQIDQNGMVTLIVRPTITTAPTSVQDPNPALVTTSINSLTGKVTTSVIPNLVPQVITQEMESVLQVGSGQIVVLGGLMQDNVQRNQNAVPGLSKIPFIGEFFSFRDNKVSKEELLVFLRPTVIANPSLDSDELKFFKRFLPKPETTGSNQ
ncbi:MAG TPA: secretin N-terminal domain-containing protein [Burkholderiales bacterium]|nr:secretin N-terminal domain-containing protein [Burkholderiales bacterium]